MSADERQRPGRHRLRVHLTTGPRTGVRQFLSNLLWILATFALFGAVLALFPLVYVGSQFGNQAALTAIGALALIVLVASFVATWWETRRNAGGSGVLLPAASAGSPDERLAELLRLASADLELNRTGRMSKAQRLRLLQADLGWLILAVVLFGEALVLALVMVDVIAGTNGKGILLELALIGGGIWAVARAFEGGVDALRGRVASERTRLDPYTKESVGGTTVYRVRTDGGHVLRVEQEIYDAIAPGTLYWVHAAPLSGKLISLEEASSAAPFEYWESTWPSSKLHKVLGELARGIQQPRREIAWAVLLAAFAMFDLVTGLSVASEFHATASLDIAATVGSFAPLVVWLVYANHLPTRRSALWTARGVALFLTLTIPWTTWTALHGLPCPPNCGPGT